MLTMLEVEPELALKIHTPARERRVSVDVYLRELIDQEETESEGRNVLSSQERVRLLREWALDTVQTRRFFLTEQLVVKRSTESAVSALLERKKYWKPWTSSKDQPTSSLLLYIS